ncbi:MAG: prephenate dehydrogenase/arogenate dehydrogenase family protein [Burkholderiales bacterium]|nr:MAG: prephenate dehydrogenase/arogenate dehydrogenase family protein [Burkholderiales bacterium]TAG84703.1 MAG: prephenate dehydrogenase/arogenate dehydrogenase family protein [Betaproteobacteria bacterium]
MKQIGTLAIVGVGLIGGSLALALKSKNAVRQVVGVGRSQANLDEALALGIIDAIASIEEAAKADVVFVATPVAQMPTIFAAMKPHLGASTIITDGGSTKQDVIAAARGALAEAFPQFVPAHPIAGTEKTGAKAAFATLYEKRKVVLCREGETIPSAADTIAELWRTAGAEIHEMSAVEHDDVFAAVSHLPHLLAFALVDMLSQMPRADQYFNYAASGFRDFTRIAGGSPEMWRDISVANRLALREQLNLYRTCLSAFDSWLANPAPEGVAAIEASYVRASAARNAWQRHIEHGEPLPKFGAGHDG